MVLSDRLKYRRQFILSSRYFEFFKDWEYYKFSQSGYHLYVHPDLELTYKEDSEKEMSLILIGFAFDHSREQFTNQQIVDEILELTTSLEGFADRVRNLAGRYVFILSLKGELTIINDPAGLRSVFYTKQDGVFAAGSQPLILSEVVALPRSVNYDTFIHSKHYKENIEYWMPCGLTLYQNTHQLVPNHYLTVKDLTQHRFWPTAAIKPVGLAEAAEIGGAMLRSLIRAANYRYKLAMGLTAGFDSRTLLGVSREISSDIYLYTMVYYKLNEESPDIQIPKSILQKYKLPHHILNCHKKIDDDFLKLFRSNVDLAHDGYASIAHGIMDDFPQDHLVIKGNVSEIARCSLYRSGKHEKIIQGIQLAKDWPEWEEIAFISNYLDDWLHRVDKMCRETNLDVFDLWYIEIFMGNWQAQNQLEKDIVHDVFAPYSYRPLIETLLGVDIRYRLHDDPVLHKQMIENFWPELLNPRWPVNPHPFGPRQRLKYRLAGKLHDWGLYKPAKFLYPKL